jgi:Fe-S cluster assembly protein SufB
MPKNELIEGLDLDQYKYDFRTEDKPVFRTEPGLTEDVVRAISAHKDEPDWMLQYRLKAYRLYLKKPMPTWGTDLSDLENTLEKIYYYVRPQDRMKNNWEDVPDNIKNTFDKLGIPEAEQKILAGVGAQYESEMVYHSLKKEWDDKGVIFDSIEDGLRKHPELFRKYFGTVVPMGDNKFAALNSAVWSGGSFVYIPKGVHLDTPLQAYFRVNQERMGQFERTLIICDEGSQAHYIEGCTAPVYSTDSFHSGVIEIVVARDARFRYTTIQNWSHNMYNLVTQRALVNENATMEWLDGNLGSKATMKYPSCYLVGEGAHGSILSIAYAGDGQHQDTGGKVYEGAKSARSNVECDALLLNETARTDTYPYIEIEERSANVGHEASVSKIGEEQLFYLMSRGMSGDEATAMIVRGFIEPIAKELPLEYAVELNRLIELEMEGSVG